MAILADLSNAIEIERRASPGGRPVALRDLLTKVIATYNRMCTIKRHRIDTYRKNLAYNLFLVSFCKMFFQPEFPTECFLAEHLRCFPTKAKKSERASLSDFSALAAWPLRLRSPKEFVDIVHQHYDCYKHEQSGAGLKLFFLR